MKSILSLAALSLIFSGCAHTNNSILSPSKKETIPIEAALLEPCSTIAYWDSAEEASIILNLNRILSDYAQCAKKTKKLQEIVCAAFNQSCEQPK